MKRFMGGAVRDETLYGGAVRDEALHVLYCWPDTIKADK
jgi:hypothetical protein